LEKACSSGVGMERVSYAVIAWGGGEEKGGGGGNQEISGQLKKGCASGGERGRETKNGDPWDLGRNYVKLRSNLNTIQRGIPGHEEGAGWTVPGLGGRSFRSGYVSEERSVPQSKGRTWDEGVQGAQSAEKNAPLGTFLREGIRYYEIRFS